MSYGAPSAGYGQPDLRVGMPVSSDNGWTGTITEIIPAAPGYEGAVRVAWHGDGTTLVALSMFVVENGQAVIRTQPPPAPQQQMAPQPQTAEDDLATRLAAPAENDPSHVNPYVNDTPLVTSEPPPIHPTHGGQMRDDSADATAIPPASQETMPMDAGMTMPLDATHDTGTQVMDADQQEMTVPVIEERVEAHPEWRDAGTIVVRTVAEEIPQTLTQETQREELFVERVAVGRDLADGEEVMPREEGDTYVIPVIIEEAVVVTRRILAEELRITKRVIPTMQTIQTVVRKERVEIDAGNLTDRVHDAGGADAAPDLPHAPRTEQSF
ncbi:MAG: YsnF/AvaK domain-containing protein [Chloroflexota bacterium]|nr:YsnF/AvaK domain-containing protein [Chloroflexota bacterium]